MSSLAGGCWCGRVRYRVADEFLYASNCHCSRCRAATGSAFKPFAGIEREKLELTEDLDQDVLRGEVELAEAVHPCADPLGDVGEPLRQVADDDLGCERASLDGRDLARGADRGRLAVREVAERHGPLGDSVGKLAPRVDELVEVLVQRL